MKTTFFFAAALVASVSAMDIKEKLKQFRDPENVNHEVRELRVVISDEDSYNQLVVLYRLIEARIRF
jgi:hypothetical protein